MIDTELLEKTLEEAFVINPEEMSEEQIQMQKDLRDAFKTGMQWGYDHPYFDKGCKNRQWHYLSEDPDDLPELNKICLIRFKDGTGSLSTMIKKKANLLGGFNPDTPGSNIPGGPQDGSLEPSGQITDKVWVTRYRDDIVAWSYYIITD